MQLKNLNISKKGINTISGVYLFNIGRIINLEANGTGSKFYYKENGQEVYWEVTDSFASINSELEVYVDSIRVSVSVSKINLTKKDNTIQLNIDSIIYAWAYPQDNTKTFVVYEGKGLETDHIIVDMNYSTFMVKINNQVIDLNSANALTVTQSLTSGDNTVVHGKGTEMSWTVKNVIVWDGNDLVATEISIIDTDSINVILSGSSITNARIEIEFK